MINIKQIYKGISWISWISLIATLAFLSGRALGGERGQNRIPPHLAEQLSEEQISQLNAASSREEKMELLKAWGIDLPPRRDMSAGHRMPPELAEKLTDEQKEELNNASTMEEKRELLDSWGIEMPKPPKRHRGEANSKLLELRQQFEAASTEEEKEQLRAEMKQLYYSSVSEEDKSSIRNFFKSNPRVYETQKQNGVYKQTTAVN